jgi:hypothetical protein
MDSSIPTLDDQRRHRERVVETIRRTAYWRRSKADQFPEYHRINARGATALRVLANFTERLEPDDLDLRSWRNSEITPDGDGYHLHPRALERLARFGLGRGSWQTGTPTEAQLRNALRRIGGMNAQERREQNERAEREASR